jgi:hypothetical protein
MSSWHVAHLINRKDVYIVLPFNLFLAVKLKNSQHS